MELQICAGTRNVMWYAKSYLYEAIGAQFHKTITSQNAVRDLISKGPISVCILHIFSVRWM